MCRLNLAHPLCDWITRCTIRPSFTMSPFERKAAASAATTALSILRSDTSIKDYVRDERLLVGWNLDNFKASGAPCWHFTPPELEISPESLAASS